MADTELRDPAEEPWSVYAIGENHQWETFAGARRIALGFHDADVDLTGVSGKQAHREKLDDISHPSNQWRVFQFNDAIEVGDVVIAKRGVDKICGFGVVTSPYFYEAEPIVGGTGDNHVRCVDWVIDLIEKFDNPLSVDVPPNEESQQTFPPNTDVHKRSEQYVEIRSQILKQIGNNLLDTDFTKQFVQLETRARKVSQRDVQQSLFLNSGSDSTFRSNLTSMFEQPLDDEQRAELQSLLEELSAEGVTDKYVTFLEELLQRDELRFWGTTENTEKSYTEMKSRDWVFHIIEADETFDVRYVQRADIVLSHLPKSMRQRLSKVLWGTEKFSSLWLSTSAIEQLNEPLSTLDTFLEGGESDPSPTELLLHSHTYFTKVYDSAVAAADGGEAVVYDFLNAARANSGDADDLHPYWETVQTKRDRARAFVEAPSYERFKELVSHDVFWATRAFGSIGYYLDEKVFPKQEPAEIAQALTEAEQGGLEDDTALDAVLELDGFGWPVATEVLRGLAPDEFAILNSRAREGLDALGYSPPKQDGTDPGEYATFVTDVREASKRYDLETVITAQTGETIPEWATPLEIADRAFTLHVSGELDLTTVTDSDEEGSDVVVDTWEPPKNVFGDTDGGATIQDLHFIEEASSHSVVEQIDHALRSGKHIILTGPPGTGKTELAKRICQHYVDQDYKLITATDDWSTFDTIGGYQPQKDDTLAFNPGVFLQRFLDSAAAAPKNEWLIIDELNRADIDKAFGSLFSALTGNNVTLPFENDDGQIELIGDPDTFGHKPITSHHYYVPPEWRLIATMNTDDKTSLYRMSYAFMRRFAYISVPAPAPEQIDAELIRTYESSWDVDLSAIDLEAIDSAAGWIPEDVDQLYGDVANIWSAIQRRRPIGPAFIEDILGHIEQQLAAGNSVAYEHAVAIYVFPQLEGCPSGEVDGMLSEMEQTVESFDRSLTDQFAEDYLDMSVDS